MHVPHNFFLRTQAAFDASIALSSLDPFLTTAKAFLAEMQDTQTADLAVVEE